MLDVFFVFILIRGAIYTNVEWAVFEHGLATEVLCRRKRRAETGVSVSSGWHMVGGSPLTSSYIHLVTSTFSADA